MLVVFRIGLRWGARHALLAAALMALMPLHVRYSHYVLTDIPLTFFVAMTMLMALSAHERPGIRTFAWAGAMAGLAAAMKYNGGLALLMPLMACWMTPAARPSRMSCMLACICAAAAAFLLTAPFTILDLPGFLDRFASLTAEYRNGSPPAEPGSIIYLKHLRLQFGLPGMLLITGGLIMGLVRAVRGPGRVPWAIALIFTIPYFLIVADQRIIYARYMLPLVPMLCVLAAAAVISGVSLLRRYQFPRGVRTALIAGLTIALLGPPAATAVSFNRIIARTLDDRSRVSLDPRRTCRRDRELCRRATTSRSRRVTSRTRLRQLRQLTYDEHVASGADYLIASSQCLRTVSRIAARDSATEFNALHDALHAQGRRSRASPPAMSIPAPSCGS